MNTPVSYEEGQAAMMKIHDVIVAHYPEMQRHMISANLSICASEMAPILTVKYYVRGEAASELAETLKTFELVPVKKPVI